ncbi:hypothetical protein MSIMFI_01353 [Mycobacterium simulans]|nr:hypothetical protein MSIMFI_01353 [Mycobacterium simulans]
MTEPDISFHWISRGVIAIALAAALYLGSVAGIPTASAHVHASCDNPVRGGISIVTFQVPNESNTGAATTALAVTLPDVASARTETMPGWTAKLGRDAVSGSVRSVTWTAAPNAGIQPDQFGLFRISVQLPDTDSVRFPTTQTYSDGSSVKWDQPPGSTGPGGAEPEHPAPTLTLVAGPVAPREHHPQSTTLANRPPDNTARWLGGVALLISALGICLALVRRRS